MEKNMFTIGEFAQKSGVSIRTLRYYDNIGLLKPSGYSEGGHRLYSHDDSTILQQIKALQFLGFPLKDIKGMLQNNTVEGDLLLKALNEQKQLFEAKKLEIENILSDLHHMIEVVENEESVHIEAFCAMLQKLMFDEDTEKWFKDHFSKDVADKLFNIQTSEEITLDKRWMNMLSSIKQLSANETTPSSKEAQETIAALLQLIDDTMKGNLEIIEEKLPSIEPLAFPNPLTEREQLFLKQAWDIYQTHHQ
ncbi:MerR family transcriptional regulator [Siminovitchia sp. FSL W7-1587]|uniref:MerR family transcriptional regulator n=1 Tax=Siminovitchia sp. FSL W7-1587 TaxID=2954699 RepID=UPI0030D0B801